MSARQPFAAHGGDTAPCAACGGEAVDGRCQRCGRFSAGNVAALIHGGSSLALMLGAQDSVAGIVAGVIRDSGYSYAVTVGVDGEPTVRTDAPATLLQAATGLGQACVLRDFSFSQAAALGPLSPMGRKCLEQWALQQAAVVAHLRMLSLRRVPKRVVDLASALSGLEPVEEGA